jgi:dihydroxyacetone kinase-like predicted kinase
MVRSLRGEIRSSDMDTSETAEESESWGEVDVPTENVFDTVYIVRKKSPDVDLLPLRSYLDSIGDSLVISDDDEIFKVHVHTDIPGDALIESQKYGTLELAKIENMRSQAEAILAGRKAQSTDDLEAVEKELEAMEENGEADGIDDGVVAAAEKHFGVVTVCAGEGMANLFRELGADGIVTGGQTMNPSTDDILKVINHTPAETVFVLPNNKNITMAAEQCIPLTDKKVIVMPTRTVPQGVSALLNLDPDADEAQVVSDMRDAIARVHTAMVTYAARDSEFDGHNIKAGEYLALLDGALLNSYPSMDALIDALGTAFEELDPEFITVYYGSDVRGEDAEHAGNLLSAHFPEAEMSIVDGGQPVYYYMISVE